MSKSGFTEREIGGGLSMRLAAMYVYAACHSQNAIENQIDENRKYALQHGMHIDRIYADEGKNGRSSLKCLVEDVGSGQIKFEVILTRDVTRWGRFQDVDEFLQYENVFRRAGIEVQYTGLPECRGVSTAHTTREIKRVIRRVYRDRLSE